MRKILVEIVRIGECREMMLRVYLLSHYILYCTILNREKITIFLKHFGNLTLFLELYT